MTTSAFVRNYDRLMLGGQADFLYGDTGFFNVGYWLPNVTSQLTACENLVRRLLKPVPRLAPRVLDVACGRGAGTRLLKEYFIHSDVTGINISEKQLRECTARAPGCGFVLMDATQLGFKDCSFDCVVCVEAAFHFDTRESFVRDAWRVLRPGGYLALSDILFEHTALVGDWMVPAKNRVRDLGAYRSLFARAAFSDIEIVDASLECWIAFCNYGLRTAEHAFHAGEIDASSFASRKQYLSSLRDQTLGHYLLLTARKPGP
jgi:MPBQ/MSBQ methyltransferase